MAAELVKTFSDTGDFAAATAAVDFLRAAGFSVGSTQAGAPRGIMFGDYSIAKWRNLNRRDAGLLDGIAFGDMRNGPVTVRIFARADQEAKTAFHKTAVALARSSQKARR